MKNKKMLLSSGTILLVSILLIAAPVFASTLAAFLWSANTTSFVGEFRNTGTGYGVWCNGAAIGCYGSATASSGIGVYGYTPGTAGLGVYGYSPYSTAVYGYAGAGSGDYGGYFTGFEGVRGYAAGSNGYGTWGTAVGSSGVGAYGSASGSSGVGAYGYASGSFGYGGISFSPNYIGQYAYGDEYGGYFYGDIGIYGTAVITSGRGVYGYASGTYGEGVRGYTAGYAGDGVNGYATASYGYGVDSYAAGYRGYGIRASASGTEAWAGVFSSGSYRGIYANGASGWYDGYFPDMIYVGGTVYSRLGMSLIARNGGTQTLEPGDLVVFSGFDASAADSSQPALSVAKAGAAGGGVIIGVVQSAYAMETSAVEQPPAFAPELPAVTAPLPAFEAAPEKDMGPLPLPMSLEGQEPSAFSAQELQADAAPAPSAPPILQAPPDELKTGNFAPETDTGHFVEGNIEPGQYVVVMIQGFARVKVNGPVKAGDSVTASTGGYARALSAIERRQVLRTPAVVVGRALESLDAGSGMIYVYVNFH